MTVFICSQCGEEYNINSTEWRCQCGSPLDIAFQPRFPLDRIKLRPANMWRYREAIPLSEHTEIITFDEGFTPLLEIEMAGRSVWVKQEQLFASGSFKDRGAAVMISKVKQLGIKKVVEDSSGNAGSAVACYCANAGIQCEIYVPASTSVGKLAQIKAYGATLHCVPGSREDTAKAAGIAAESCYYASHSWNPFFIHGTKTFSLEVCEQLGWKAPDTIILPVGNGATLLGAFQGFSELCATGVTDHIPRIFGVQAEQCAPIYKAFKKNLPEVPEIKGNRTIAEGIAIAAPVRGKQILDAVKHTGGQILAVSETEITEALNEMHSQGFYIEPTSAVAPAGIKKYFAQLAEEEQAGCVVSVFTGHGLKSTKN